MFAVTVGCLGHSHTQIFAALGTRSGYVAGHGGGRHIAATTGESTVVWDCSALQLNLRRLLVASLARPGGNVTGLTSLTVELATKRLEILKDAVPMLARVGLLWLPGASGISRDLQMKELRPAPVALMLKLEEIETQPDVKGLESPFKSQSRNRWARS